MATSIPGILKSHERASIASLRYRPGMTRLSFPYFMNRATVDYVIKAVAMVAKHGWKLLPQVIYRINYGRFGQYVVITNSYMHVLLQYTVHV